jgi:predicted nucleic acid-binding protein
VLTVDANIWVATMDPREPGHADCRSFFLRARALGRTLTCPWLVVIEASAAVARKSRDPQKGYAMTKLIQRTPMLKFLDLSRVLLESSLELACRLFLRGPDAIYAAVAKHSGSTLITLDAELRQRAAVEIYCLTPLEWLAQQ